jgi:predicted RNase H-like nuclease
MSQQSYALARRILEVDAEVAAQDVINEVHPEVSFAAMADSHLQWPKTTWAGMMQRLELLGGQGIEIPPNIPRGNDLPPADVIDAAAAAWSATRIAAGTGKSVIEPEVDNRGRQVTIWF